MPPRTSHVSEEATRRHSDDEDGDDQASDQNSSNNDQCSYSYSNGSHPAVYQGDFMDEKLGIPNSKVGTKDDNVILTLSDEASVSSLEDSYVEGDSWSTIEDDEEISNHLITLTDIYSPDEADRLYIFTDEENSPPIVPSEPMDFSSSLSHRTTSDSSFHDRRSESASVISDQWIPRKYMMWPRRNSLGLSGDSDDLYSSDYGGFLSKAVMSMRRRRRRRNSLPVTSLLSSTSSNISDIDIIQVDRVSSWEDESNSPRDSESLSVQKNIDSLKARLGEQGNTMRKSCGAGFESNRSLPMVHPFSVVEKRQPDRLLNRVEGNKKVGGHTKDHSDHLTSLISSTGEQLTLNLSKQKRQGKERFVDSQNVTPGLEETESASVHSADEEPLAVGLCDDSGTSQRKAPRKLDFRKSDHICLSKIQKRNDHDAVLNTNRRMVIHGKESMSDDDYRVDDMQIFAINNDTRKQKESDVLHAFSNLEASHTIGWKRVRRNSKPRKKSSGGNGKAKAKRGNEEKLRVSRIQSNAVSLQSGKAPWSPDLIRSVTPISTAGLDARPTSRSIAASLGIEEEADTLLSIFSEAVAQQTRRKVSAKEGPKMTFIQLTEDICIPNFGLFVLQSIQNFKFKLSI
ncbi:hypothetical protein FisN_38Lh014 [Fistulifera solaris]|uniref:Uncharacterized protein n=1 Tax=Fistulifera solaris TaxID=1519565 RepID=A0A1Z5J6H1_FISSO|nr:hypothetical protein FisN_38Lh014 [Fistulifera solaris]|eukprot:GAX09593.1 hypothetical protein FisN_38Lh014 [Fistulifera solaris]